MGMEDKFNEMKHRVSDAAEDAKDKAENLYNKAKESPVGDKMGDMADDVKERARDAASKFKGGRK